MPIKLTKPDTAEVLPSIRRSFREGFEIELSEPHSTMVLNYILKEVAPFAYNQAVNDAESYFRAPLEELPGVCYEPPLTHWQNGAKQGQV